jgi:hypothetical protein
MPSWYLAGQHGQLVMRELRRGDVRSRDGFDILQRVRGWRAPSEYGGDKLRRMLRRALLGAVGFELCELRRGDVLTSGCERLLELHGGMVRDAHRYVAVCDLPCGDVFIVGVECVLELRSGPVCGVEWCNCVLCVQQRELPGRDWSNEL